MGGEVLRGHRPRCSRRCPILTLSRGGKMRCWLVPNSSLHVLRWKPSEPRCEAGGAPGQGREPGLRPRSGDATERDHPRPPAGLGTRPLSSAPSAGSGGPWPRRFFTKVPPRCSGSHGRCEPAKNRRAGPQRSRSEAPRHQGPAGITASAPPSPGHGASAQPAGSLPVSTVRPRAWQTPAGPRGTGTLQEPPCLPRLAPLSCWLLCDYRVFFSARFQD